MPRPNKAGLDYFPHNTDAAGDEKMQSLMALHGPAGYCFYFVMLEKVFRSENGRITCGKPSEKAGLARLMCVTPKQFDAILLTALEVGCFDKNLYDESQIITSNGVQKRLATVLAVRSKDKNRKIRSESKRKEEEKEEIEIENQTRKTTGKLPENPRKTTGKLPENPRKTTGKLKVIETKELFLRYVYLFRKEYDALLEKLGDARAEYIERLDGYIAQIGEVTAKKKYVSHYDTILNWNRKDIKEGRVMIFKKQPDALKETTLDQIKKARAEEKQSGENNG